MAGDLFPYDPSLIHWDTVDSPPVPDKPELISDDHVKEKVRRLKTPGIFYKPTKTGLILINYPCHLSGPIFSETVEGWHISS